MIKRFFKVCFIIILVCTNSIFGQTYKVTNTVYPQPYPHMLDNQYFGKSIAMDSNYLVVGVYGYENNAGCVYIYKFVGSVWNYVARLSASDKEADDYFGYSVGISGNTIVVGAYGDDDNGSNSGAVYVFEKPQNGWTNSTQTAKLKASDGAADDLFGKSVAISGNDIIVGSVWDDDNGSFSGSAYVFSKPLNGWTNATETAKLKALDGSQGNQFGYSVAISGSTILVGTNKDNDNGSNSGSAYIFQKPLNGWISTSFYVAKLKPADGASGDNFGISVSISNDVAVIGANQNDDAGSNSGSAYVFVKPLTGWINSTETAKLLPSDGTTNTMFGNCVSIANDTIVIGAYGDDDNGLFSGSAYVFEKTASGWVNATQTAKLKPSDGAADDYFSNAVVISGDKIICGAFYDDDMGANAGSAYYFHKSGNTWINSTQFQKILPPIYTQNTNEQFGASCEISGDFAVIGAPGHDEGKGIAYIAHYDGSLWSIIARLQPSDVAAGDNFGYAVDMDGDYVIVGSPNDDDWGSSSGSAYVFAKPLSGWADMNQTAKLTASSGAANDLFGASVAISGNDVVIGAAQSDAFAINAGASYIFSKPTGGWASTNNYHAILHSADIYNGDEFGSAVDIQNNIIVVGSRLDDDNGINSGSAYVFKKPTSGWIDTTQVAKLLPDNGNASAEFGGAVCISGNNIVVGASKSTINNITSGATYLFTKSAQGWVNSTQQAEFLATDAASGNLLGFSVKVFGDTIISGAPQNDASGNNAGAAYMYLKPDNQGWIDTTENQQMLPAAASMNYLSGSSVSAASLKLLVGTSGDSHEGTNAGSATFYEKCSTTGIHTVTACQSYTWMNGITYTSNNNSAKYTISNVAGCDSIVTLHLTIKTVDTLVHQNNQTLTANLHGAQYQWLNCNNDYAIINGANAQSFSPAVDGSYALEITYDGCTDTSACHTIIGIGINEVNPVTLIKIYPNPTKGDVTIDFAHQSGDYKISVTNITGKIIDEKLVSGKENYHLNLLYNPGLYFIEITDGSVKKVFKIVKE